MTGTIEVSLMSGSAGRVQRLYRATARVDDREYHAFAVDPFQAAARAAEAAVNFESREGET